MSRKVAVVLSALLAAAVVSGCGGNNKVGSKSLVNFKDQAQQRLGATTSTVAGPATTAAGGSGHLGIGGATTTTAAPRATTTVAPQQAFEIDINGDNSGTTQFDPPAARVFVGTSVKFVNKDSVARSVESDNNAFASGPIAPNGSWTYKPGSAGQFNYHDGTRPYAVGSLEVVSK
jgi:plastocyanin